jgi:protein TonB
MTAESASSPIIEEKIFQVVEQMPQFPGGENAMMKFIMKNFNTSNLSESDEIVGKFIVGFIVREDGSISDIKVKRSVSPTYDAEALRVLKSFPKFKPGRQNGKAVPVSFILPIYLDFSRN